MNAPDEALASFLKTEVFEDTVRGGHAALCDRAKLFDARAARIGEFLARSSIAILTISATWRLS